MPLRTAAAVVLVCLAVVASAQSVSTKRTYAEGQKERARLVLESTVGARKMLMNFVFATDTSALRANGGAQVQRKIENLKIEFGEQTLDIPGPDPEKYEVDRFGLPKGEVDPVMLWTLMLDYQGGSDARLGRAKKYEVKVSGITVTGEATVQKVEGDTATFFTRFQYKRPEDSLEITVDASGTYNLKTGRLIRVTGTGTNIGPAVMMGRGIKSTFVMETIQD